MTELRPNLPTLPEQMRRLPLDHRGFPVPWFVAWFDGVPDFRCIDTPKLGVAVNQRRCWVCGGKLGRYMAFVIGPMCAVTRVSSEPPCHRDCAVFAAQGCPFLSQPRMRRNEKDLPEAHRDPAGVFIDRNPGATCVWITKSYEVFRAGRASGGDGILFKLGDPVDTLWYANHRNATRAEVEASITSGLPLLRAADGNDPEANAEIDKAVATTMLLLPAA